MECDCGYTLRMNPETSVSLSLCLCASTLILSTAAHLMTHLQTWLGVFLKTPGVQWLWSVLVWAVVETPSLALNSFNFKLALAVVSVIKTQLYVWWVTSLWQYRVLLFNLICTSGQTFWDQQAQFEQANAQWLVPCTQGYPETQVMTHFYVLCETNKVHRRLTVHLVSNLSASLE